MPPSFSTVRPVWVWSFPALAIILSFLWYRKKRGSLKTDSGGAGETQNDRISVVDSEEEEITVTVVAGTKEIENVLADASEDTKPEVNEVFESNKLDINVESIARSVNAAEPVLSNNTPLKGEEKVVKEEITVIVDKEDIAVGEATVEKEEIVAKTVEKQEGGLIELKDEKENPEEEQKEVEKVEDIEKTIKAVEESVIPVKQESQPAKVKCGKKKKFRDMAKKSSESSPDQRQGSKEESTVCILEQKLAKLDLVNQCSSHGTDEKQTNEDVAERDSANNSPSEVMLASPSVSGYSDTHSEGSSDSGKGCSEMLTPSRTPASGNSVSGDLPVTSIYEFVIPQQLVGRLIGRHGSYVNEIKETTHASIYIKRHPETPKLKICAVEGTQMDIESALDMIRRKFPKKRYPNVTLEQVVISPEPQMIPIISENMQLYLIEGINNDVILSSLVSAGHFFLQQPTHPTYLSLSRLNSCMMYCYSEPDQPTIPEGVGAGILCAAPVHNGWYRAQIVSMDAENNVCDVKFVDYGGYMTMPVSALRQIRVDFVNLPFQAAECYLAGVKPANEENVWCEKAKELVEELTFGKVLQAQVYGYAEDTVPLIYLYTVVNDEVILINQKLVDRGFAEWLYSEPVTEDVQEMASSELEETAPVAVAV